MTDRVINLEEAKWKHEEQIDALTLLLGQKEDQIIELINKDQLKQETIELLSTQGREFSDYESQIKESLITINLRLEVDL